MSIYHTLFNPKNGIKSVVEEPNRKDSFRITISQHVKGRQWVDQELRFVSKAQLDLAKNMRKLMFGMTKKRIASITNQIDDIFMEGYREGIDAANESTYYQ